MNSIGSNSTGATLANCIRQSLNKYPHLSSSLNFEWLVQAAKHIAKMDISETIELSPAQLPPKSLAAICIAGEYFHQMYWRIHMKLTLYNKHTLTTSMFTTP